MSYRDVYIRETPQGPEIVCTPDAESGMVPVLPMAEKDLALLGRRIAGRIPGPGGERDPQVARLLRLVELLYEYGMAKFGDEWWPRNAGDWIGYDKGAELKALLESPPPGAEPGGENDARVIAAADVKLRQAEVERRAAELDRVPAGTSFPVRVAGRLFQITPHRPFSVADDRYVPVDCRDVRTHMESQAIVRASVLRSRMTLLGVRPLRDAVKSAYLNATALESGDYPAGGVLLPDNFMIEVSDGPV